MAFSGSFFAAITLENGTAHTLDRIAGPATFMPMPTLGSNNIRITTAANGRVCTIDDSLANQLRFVYQVGTGWSSPLLIADNVALAGIDNGQGNLPELVLLALSGSITPGWPFSLQLFYAENGKPVRDLGDQTAHLILGDLDAGDPPVALHVLHADPGILQLFLATLSGGIYYLNADLARGGSGFHDVKAKAGNPGNVVSVSSAQSYEGLHVCVVNEAGVILHTILDRAGNWKRWGNLNAATRSMEKFTQVAMAAINEQILLGITDAGDLLYTIRQAEEPDPVWAPFIPLKLKSDSPMGAVTSVALAAPYTVG